MKRYERPVIVASYTSKELREDAALVVAASGGYDGHKFDQKWG